MVSEWMLMTAAEVSAQAEANALVIIPVASMEQHGPHLATGVDIVLGTAVAQGVAARLQAQGVPAITMPCVWSGLAEHHMAFGGSVTLNYATLSGVLRELIRSALRAGYTAHAAKEELHFHLINPRTGDRVRMLTLDAGTEREVAHGDLAKGYEFEKDTFVLLDDADFEHSKIDSSTVLSVDKFVTADAIDPVYYDGSYYMVPDGEAGQDVYVVLRDAIAKAVRIALSRLVIARRERAVAIMPMGHGLVLHTLHDEKDVHDPRELFAGVPGAKPDPAMVKLATQLIDRQTSRFDPADMEDRYEARLREVIAAKLRGEEQAPEPEPEDDRSNVVDLMAALKRSLGQATDTPKRSPAKKTAKKVVATKREKSKAAGSHPAGGKRTAVVPSRRRA